MNDILRNGAGHLLVVDDSPTVRKLVEITFRGTSWTIELAGSGAEAIQSAIDRAPRLILLDVVLPDLTATEVCDRLAADPRTEHIPIVLMSAKDETVRRQFSRYDSVVDFIHKPFTRDELAQRIGAVARRDERREALAATGWKSALSGRWPPSEICSLIGASAGTGELILRAGSSTIVVYWSCGEIVFVTSLDPLDHRAWMDESTESITPQVIEAAEELQRSSGKPTPVTLSDDGELPLSCDLGRLLREVGRALLSRALSAAKASFEWRELEALPSFVSIHGRKLPIARDGAAKAALDEATWPWVQTVFRRAAPAFAKVDESLFTVRARRVLSLIDGRSSLDVVAERAGLDIPYVSRIAHSLACMGLIEPAPRPANASVPERVWKEM